MRGISAPKMGSYTVLLWVLYIVASSRAAIHLSWPNEDSEIDFWDDTAAKTKRSESSSSQSSYSSSSSSSSSSDSSGAFHFKVEEYEKKTDKSGTHEVTKTYEKKKPSGGNETSNTKTVEVTRFPNGTIQRKVKNRGPALKAECTKDKDCAANKFCSQFLYKCQNCIDDFGCFSTRQCCGGKVCKFGRCVTEPARTGLAKSPCNDDRECKAGLYCSYNDFDGGRCVQLRKDGERCNKGMFSRRRPKCAPGLECKATRGFGFFVDHKCRKPGSLEDKSTADSPFDWFNWRI